MKKVLSAVEEEEFIKQYLIPKKLRKKQYLLQEDDVCKHLCVVEKGALKAYVLTESGDERITAFAFGRVDNGLPFELYKRRTCYTEY